MSLVQAIGLTVLPQLGGFAGSLITRTQIDAWYEVKNLWQKIMFVLLDK